MKNKHFIVYKITNKLNDNIYIGCHVTENINDKYMGSGSNIKKAIKEFGKENFEKIILFNLDNEKEMLEKERELVNDEFIKRGDTYNIMLGGYFNATGTVTVKDIHDNNFQVHKTDPRYLSGELVGIAKGTITIKDKNNNKFRVAQNDIRFLSGEFVGITDKTITVKDKNNNNLQVSIEDPRYLSGELDFIWKNKKHSIETIEKMKLSHQGKHNQEKNSQYGTCWIYNEKLKQNKKIKKEELNNWLENNWIKGRKQNI